jgi:hypothetical protein
MVGLFLLLDRSVPPARTVGKVSQSSPIGWIYTVYILLDGLFKSIESKVLNALGGWVGMRKKYVNVHSRTYVLDALCEVSCRLVRYLYSIGIDAKGGLNVEFLCSLLAPS